MDAASDEIMDVWVEFCVMPDGEWDHSELATAEAIRPLEKHRAIPRSTCKIRWKIRNKQRLKQRTVSRNYKKLLQGAMRASILCDPQV